MAPKAPWVLVWESPQAIVVPAPHAAAIREAFMSTTLTSMSGALSAIIAIVGPPT